MFTVKLPVCRIDLLKGKFQKDSHAMSFDRRHFDLCNFHAEVHTYTGTTELIMLQA